MSRKRQTKKKTKGGFIPGVEDLVKGYSLHNTKHDSDKEKNRTSIFEKTSALKDLIAWIKFSLNDIPGAFSKSFVPPITLGLNRVFFNRFDENWISKNLLSAEQMGDYMQEIDSMNNGKITIDITPTIFGKKIGYSDPRLRIDHLRDLYLLFGKSLLYYLKQLHILITGNGGPFGSSNQNFYSNMLVKELYTSEELVVSEDFEKFLTKKFGKDYLEQFKTNYDKVRIFFYSQLLPKINGETKVDAHVDNDSMGGGNRNSRKRKLNRKSLRRKRV